nr:PD-(D/E)XK nuclease family transposase [Pedobacter nyackensis]
MTKARFIDPLTDYGFKRLFGSEPDKDIMIDFLNALFEGEKIVADITYSPTEYSGEDSKEKKCSLI